MRICAADTRHLTLFAGEVCKPWCVLIPAAPPCVHPPLSLKKQQCLQANLPSRNDRTCRLEVLQTVYQVPVCFGEGGGVPSHWTVAAPSHANFDTSDTDDCVVITSHNLLKGSSL